MKGLVLLIALSSLTALANDKVAYVTDKLLTNKTYILCEGSGVETIDGRSFNRTPEDNLNQFIGILRSHMTPMLIEISVDSLSHTETKACVILNVK